MPPAMISPLRIGAIMLALALSVSEPGAQTAAPGSTGGRIERPSATQGAASPEIIRDLSRLPPRAARMRERILEAARSGDLDKLLIVMESNETLPVFSFDSEKDPIAFWKAIYPASDGLEILAILIQVLETGFVHVHKGTPQEMYVWPYFAHVPLKRLTPEQKIELFRIATGSDYKKMKEFGAYIFYRVGIAPDGIWHFFIAGD
jgi:hypothetical protein